MLLQYNATAVSYSSVIINLILNYVLDANGRSDKKEAKKGERCYCPKVQLICFAAVRFEFKLFLKRKKSLRKAIRCEIFRLFFLAVAVPTENKRHVKQNLAVFH